jgi:hypothetical protein
VTITTDGCATSTRRTRDIIEAGQVAMSEALRLWSADVYDPQRSDKSAAADHSRRVIDEIIMAAGWEWQVPYKGDGQVEWCGLFAAACWRAAGLDTKWLATYFASTYRLDTWARYRDFNPDKPNKKPAQGPYRLIADFDAHSTSVPWEPQAGDILMIGDGNPAMGDHITLVVSYDPTRKVFATLEGNGVGLGPDGKRRQGIVRGLRNLGGQGYCARRLIRPAVSDLG